MAINEIANTNNKIVLDITWFIIYYLQVNPKFSHIIFIGLKALKNFKSDIFNLSN